MGDRATENNQPIEYVYFIKPKGEKGPICIGGATDVMREFGFLQEGSVVELELKGVVDAHIYPEGWWHEAFVPYLIRGRWYEASAQLLCRIEDAVAGRLKAPRYSKRVYRKRVLDGWRCPKCGVFLELYDGELMTEAELVRAKAAEKIPERYQRRVGQKVMTRGRRKLQDRLAWPDADPYPEVDVRPVELGVASDVVRILAKKLGGTGDSTSECSSD